MEARLSLQELIQLAVNGEKASYALYSRAAAVTASEKVKKIFNRIARDELFHLFTLLKKFKRLYPALIEEVNIIMPTPEESEVKKLATVNESAEALQCAIEEEHRSLRLYLQLVKVAEDKEAAQALETIIRDETNHIRALNALKDGGIGEFVEKEKRFH